MMMIKIPPNQPQPINQSTNDANQQTWIQLTNHVNKLTSDHLANPQVVYRGSVEPTRLWLAHIFKTSTCHSEHLIVYRARRDDRIPDDLETFEGRRTFWKMGDWISVVNLMETSRLMWCKCLCNVYPSPRGRAEQFVHAGRPAEQQTFMRLKQVERKEWIMASHSHSVITY